MALFPKIQSPCPYKANLAAVMDGDFCRMCKRQVTDLTAMSDGERVSFFESCADDQVCVSYRMPALAAIALGASLAAAAPAMAGDLTTEVVVVGGVHKPAKVEFVQTADAALAAATAASPELPVVYDAKPADASQPAKPADPTQPAKAPDASKPAK